MASFIKDSTDYGIFILESNGVNNDDWEGDHSHIKEADWDLYTEGMEGIFLPYAGEMRHKPEFNFEVIDFFLGEGVDVSLGEGHDLIIFEGKFGGATETIRNTKMENLLLFFWKHFKLDTEQIYLGYRKKGEVWEPFIDSTPAVVYYLKGKLVDASYYRYEDELFYNWKVVFRGVQ